MVFKFFQFFTIRKALQNSADASDGRGQQTGNRREFSRLPQDQLAKRAATRENESFSYESDRQALIYAYARQHNICSSSYQGIFGL